MDLREQLFDVNEKLIPDLWRIKTLIFDFVMAMDHMREDAYHVTRGLQVAEKCLHSARMMILNTIEPESNIYIKKEQKGHDWLKDNLGRIDNHLDGLKRDMIDSVERSAFVKKSPKIMMRIDNYKMLLYLLMESLVVFPIRKAYNKYKIFRESEYVGLKKDKYLFSYFIFVQMSSGAQMYGAITRQETHSIPKNVGTVNLSPTSSVDIPEIPIVEHEESREEIQERGEQTANQGDLKEKDVSEVSL